MERYIIKSPSGKTFTVVADSIYHAVSKVVNIEGWKYSNIDYLKINICKKKKQLAH
jgi:hypothetical protein